MAPFRALLLGDDDPVANLALEQLLFEEGDPAENLLLLYVNAPCIVIGRSQNPLLECDLGLMRRLGIPVVRRYTGGGTVYHDPGNLNFSLMTPREEYDKVENAKQILAALATLGVTADVTRRNDLVSAGRKFSGSAYRLTRHRALHHGTLLVESDLPLLRALLRPTIPGIEGRGVASVPSPVVSLADLRLGLTVDRVREALVETLTDGTPETIEAGNHLYRESVHRATGFRSKEWIFGRTPRFCCTLIRSEGPLRIEARQGKIVSVDPAEATDLIGAGIEALIPR